MTFAKKFNYFVNIFIFKTHFCLNVIFYRYQTKKLLTLNFYSLKYMADFFGICHIFSIYLIAHHSPSGTSLQKLNT